MRTEPCQFRPGIITKSVTFCEDWLLMWVMLVFHPTFFSVVGNGVAARRSLGRQCFESPRFQVPTLVHPEMSQPHCATRTAGAPARTAKLREVNRLLSPPRPPSWLAASYCARAFNTMQRGTRNAKPRPHHAGFVAADPDCAYCSLGSQTTVPGARYSYNTVSLGQGIHDL